MAYFMCNTSNIKEMKYGRPQTVMFEGVNSQANGIIVDLGDTMEGTPQNDRSLDHVHKIEVANLEATAVIGKWIVIAPEINVEQYRRIDNQVDNFDLEPNTTYSAYQLQKHDRIEYTDGYFDNPNAIQVGDFVNISANGTFEKQALPLGNDAFRVVSVVNTHLPFTLATNALPNQDATLLPTVGKKIKLEVVR